MELSRLLSSYGLEEAIIDDSRYILYPTDFEVIQLRNNLSLNSECVLVLDNLIRFIHPDFLENPQDENFELLEFHFVPSHIEKDILQGIRSDNIPAHLKKLCPDFFLEEKEEEAFFSEDEYDIEESYSKPKVKEKEKNNRSTSFFHHENIELDELLELITKLKTEIRSLGRHRVSKGKIENKGILIKSHVDRTDNPRSVHYSFLKISKEYGPEFAQLTTTFSVVN